MACGYRARRWDRRAGVRGDRPCVGVAALVEDAAHRSILPLGRRASARAAIDEGLECQLSELQQEAGVRERL
jgi:hypothetical protein